MKKLYQDNNMGTTWELDDSITTVTIDSNTLSISPTVSNITFSPTDDDVIDLDLFTREVDTALDITDATINGNSLADTLAEMQQRLGMIEQNLELEEEWQQLRDLGDQYRKLEQEINEKTQAWDSLKLKKNNKA